MQFKKKHTMSFLLSICLVFTMFFLPTEQASAASIQLKVANTNSLNLRTGPSTKYKVIKVLKKKYSCHTNCKKRYVVESKSR